MRSTGPLEDRIAIRELVESYVDAVFRVDAEAWASHWDADASWHIAGQVVQGREAIVGLWKTLMGNFALAAMYPTNGGVALSGNSGQGRWYYLEALRPKAGPPFQYISYYDDEYVKGADGLWRFASRRYTLLHELRAPEAPPVT
jgi:ketosteroid isomerase-like protein